MRKFWSYGSIDTDLHYYVPRHTLIDDAILKLVGEKPEKGGHYITIWAPRQRGKTWIMQQVLFSLRDKPEYQAFDVVHLPLESLKTTKDIDRIAQKVSTKILEQLGIPDISIKQMDDFEQIFTGEVLTKPLILILDEFDALIPEAISGLVSAFRNIYLHRQNQSNKANGERDYLLHGVALIGVRAVLGIENKTGSPFNVQQSVHIPNLTFEEVNSMFKWYEQESGQEVEQAVIDQVFYETNGQPGLVGWLGELLTEKTYNPNKNKPITMFNFEEVYAAAIKILPNSNILNIISKAKQEPYKQTLLELFKTSRKMPFDYDKEDLSFLYMNGVIDWEKEGHTDYYVKFPCPFVQKRLFNYFANDIFDYVGQLYDAFDEMDDVFTPQGLHIPNLLKRYEVYLQKNRTWLFKNAPRRHDLRLYEAVYHFNFYKYLAEFFQSYEAQVWIEFPTGNGQIDLVIKYQGQIYALEVKSFANKREYEKALTQTAVYAHQLNLPEITLVLFIEGIDDMNRAKYEQVYQDTKRGVTVVPVFVVTGA